MRDITVHDSDPRGLKVPMPSSELARSKRLTPDEITDLIHELAKTGEGADQRWALKMLAPQENSLQLATPMSDAEIVRRGARLLKGMGFELSKQCFAVAHPQGVPLGWKVPERRTDGPLIVPTTLKALYEMFPEAERDPKTDAPPGYPEMTATTTRKRRWVYDYAVKLLHARKEAGAVSTEGGEVTDDRPAQA